MPNYTTNLNLEKPLQSEQYNVDVFNANADKIDQFAGQTPPRALTADKLTTGAKINGVNFKGDSDILLPIVDVDGETIVKNDNGIISAIVDENIANTDLSNLTETGNNRLHALKSYSDEGELLTDPEGLSDVTSYAHSTFDLSKFTVVGSPNITDNGIVTQTDWQNYVSTLAPIDFSKRVVVKEKFEFNSKTFNSTKWAVRIGNIGGLYFTSGYLQTSINDAYSNDVSSSVYNVNEPIYMNWVIDGTSSVCTLTQNNNIIATLTSTITALSSSYTINLLGVESDTSDKNNGSIDLKQFSITVDGVPVFSGNQTGVDTYTINGSTVTIPYTLSKTGSKIVDSVYRDRVASVYEYLGYAPYYTLQENQEENYTIIGSPTISNGIASGFSTDDYISIPFSPAYSAWEIILKTKLNSTGTPILNCGTYSFNLAVAPNVQDRRNKLIINIGNGTTWATTNLLGVTELQTNIDYYIKIKYTGTNYIISLSTDNISWIDEITYTSSTPINSNTLILGKDYLEANALNGSIDLNELTINIEGNNSFKAIQPPNFTLPQGEIYGMMNKNIQAGTITFGAFSTVPLGWLICDGSALSRASYADLFNAIGTTFGSGDGSTTFNLPDLIGKVVNGNSTVGISTGITTSDANVGHTHSAWQYHGDYLTTSSAGQNHTHTIDSIDLLPIIKY